MFIVLKKLLNSIWKNIRNFKLQRIFLLHFNLAILYLSRMIIFQFFIKSINPSWFLYNNMGFNVQFVEVEVLWEFLMAKLQFLHTQISFLLLSVFQTTTDQVHFYPHLSSSLFLNFNYVHDISLKNC